MAPIGYAIRVRGALDPAWSSWFEGMDVQSDRPGETVIAGPVADQAALHGLLRRIESLGLELVEVRRFPPTAQVAPAPER